MHMVSGSLASLLLLLLPICRLAVAKGDVCGVCTCDAGESRVDNCC
jgi:hypothetical protein